MQALYKMVASFLSVALIFTSVAPSFAQTRSNSPFKVSGSNALGDAVNRHVTQTLEKAEDAYWVERGTKLVATQQRVVTLPYIVETLEKAKENAPKQDILQAQVCDKENLNCVPALAYAWGGVHYAAKNLLYYQAKPIIETAPQLATLITEYGLHSEQDRQAVRTYFYKLIKEADGDCDSGFMQRYLEVGSESNRVDARQANANKAKRCQAEVSVLPALAMIEKTPYEKQLAAKEIYSLLKSGYDQDQGAEIMYSAVTALGVLDTEQAYRHLDRFLTQDTIPSVAGNVWEGLWSPGKSTAQNSLRAASNIRGGNSRYLNRINEQFQYLDKAEAKRQGFNNTAWQSEGRQYPYGNVLEEIGVFLGQQSASSPFAKNLAKKLVAKANEAAKSKTNAAGTLHYPVVLGILDGWRAHGKQFIFVPDPALLSLFYKGDWFDINEGTQRRIHYKVWQFAQLRGYTGWKAPVFDKEKNQRYIYNARILGTGQAADVVAPLLMAEGLFRVVPALAKGIPGAVRTLRAHKAWVGTKNYLQSAKVAKPVAKEVPLKPAPAAQQVAPKSTKPAQLSVAKVDNKTVQILPKGYTVEQLNPGRTNIAPKTFASTGDGVAPGKPLSNAKQAKADKFQYKSQRQQDKRIYKEAEEMMQPTQTAPAAPRTLSWKDKARFQWEANFKPAFQNLFKFGTSRYGLSALGTGAAPVTSEAAIMANTPVIAQTVRAQQSAFIAEEFLRGGAGASYRVGAVNPGGVAAAHYAQAALNAVSPATQAAKILAMSMGASRTVQTVAPRYGNGMAYSLVFPVPSFIMNRMLQARMPAEDGSEVSGLGNGPRIHSNSLLAASVLTILEQYRPNWRKEVIDYLHIESPAKAQKVIKALEIKLNEHTNPAYYFRAGDEENAKGNYKEVVSGLEYRINKADAARLTSRESPLFVALQLKEVQLYVDRFGHPIIKNNQTRSLYSNAQIALRAGQKNGATLDTELLKMLLDDAITLETLKQQKAAIAQAKEETRLKAKAQEEARLHDQSIAQMRREQVLRQAREQEQKAQSRKQVREQKKQAAILERLPQRLNELEAFALAHNNKLPQQTLGSYTKTRDDVNLGNQVRADIEFLMEHDMANHPLVARFNALKEAHTQQVEAEKQAAHQAALLRQQERERQAQEERAQTQATKLEERKRKEAEERELHRFLLQEEKEWEQTQKELHEQDERWKLGDVAEQRAEAPYLKAASDENTDANATKAARAADARIFTDQVDDSFIGRLLAFYNSITGADGYTANISQNSPQQWANQLQKFIDKHHRAPNRYAEKEITSQQMQDENRLAKSVYGLLTRLPERDPNWQRLENLMAGVGMDKQTRIQRTQARQQTAFAKLRQGYQAWSTEQKFSSTQELYQQLVKYVQESKRYPLSRSYLYQSIYGRLKYYQSTMVNGKYADPWLQKIYELKTALQAAENGNIRLEKQGENYIVIVTQATTAAQTPQKHALVLQVNELTGQILEQVGAQASLQRTHYASWLRKAHDNGYIVGDDATYKVLFNVERMVQNYANLNIAQRTLVNDVLDTLGQYQAFVGRQKGGFFYKIAYKGTEDTLLAQNFYLQAERTGWEWDADSPDKEIEKISQSLGDSGYLASRLEEDPDEEFASQIVFNENITSETAKKHLNDLLKVFNDLGYTVRMGTHELGLVQNKDNTFTVSSAFRTGRLHIHLEHAPDPEAEIPVGINIRFYIDAGPFTGPINRLTRQSLGNLPDDEIAANYFGLFRSSLTKEAREALAQIVKSSTKAK